MFKVLHESFLFPGTGDVKAERKVNGLCTGKSFPSSQALKPAVDYLKSPFTKKTGFLFCLDLRFLIMCLCTCWWGQRSIALLPQQLCILCAEAESQPGVHGFIRLAGQQAQGLLSPPSLGLESTSSCLYGECFPSPKPLFNFSSCLGLDARPVCVGAGQMFYYSVQSCCCSVSFLLITGVLILVWK